MRKIHEYKHMLPGPGKRGSPGRTAADSRLFISRGFAAQFRLVVGQVRVDAESNETAAMPKRLELLDAEGRTAAADAMHTQRATAEEAAQGGGDNAPALKGN